MSLRIPSILGRLLYEISWEGNAKIYREGGRGRENVLTAEVLQALDYLPRQFFENVIQAMTGADAARATLIEEIEETSIELLPGSILLKPSESSWQNQIPVQPDGIIISPSIHSLIEAKRIKSSSFQPKQLARELVAVHQEAESKTPLLFLITGTEPPYRVNGHGKLTVTDAVMLYIADVVMNETESADEELADKLLNSLSETVCHITWTKLNEAIQETMANFVSPSPSIGASIERLSTSIQTSVKWHS